MKIETCGEILNLLPERAFYWERENLLGLSDVHIGKTESYQKMGIPLPSGAHHQEFQRICNLIEKYKPAKIIILGDWIHQKDSWTPELFNDMKAFFQMYSEIHWILLIGNHERGSKGYLEQLGIEIVEGDYYLEPFCFSHGHEKTNDKTFRIEGHIHPLVTLKEGPLKMKFPCFVLSPESLLLPSFGTLTGGVEVSSHGKKRIFAVTPKDVFEIRP